MGILPLWKNTFVQHRDSMTTYTQQHETARHRAMLHMAKIDEIRFVQMDPTVSTDTVSEETIVPVEPSFKICVTSECGVKRKLSYCKLTNTYSKGYSAEGRRLLAEIEGSLKRKVRLVRYPKRTTARIKAL